MRVHSLAIALTVLWQARANLQKQSLANVDPHAVCTDGSPAAYYFKPAASKSNIWIFHLEGGGWCFDEVSCAQRCGTPQHPKTSSSLCSSKNWQNSIALGGIFYDSTIPAMKNAHKVFIRYCTSDGHMGNASAMGWQFRGKAVVQATLRDLKATKGLGGDDMVPDTILFGGSSAGGRGAMVHLDYIPEMLGDATNVEAIGFLDSPVWIDMDPMSKSFPGFRYITQHVHSFANVEHLGTDCAAQYPDELWKCMFGQYRLPTLRTRYFLVGSQYDAYQLGNNVGHKPQTVDEKAYAEEFAKKIRSFVESLKVNHTHDRAVFSWACYNHAVAQSPGGFGKLTCGPSGTTMESALHQFLGLSHEKPTSPPDTWIDSCVTFCCGSGCNKAVVEAAEEPEFTTEQAEALEQVVV